MTAMREEVG